MPTQTEQIMALREKTGAGMMDCKKAITESAGDFDKALEFLRKKGLADAAKKSSRTTKEGVIAGAVTADGRSAALVEIGCETDFVAKTDDFLGLASQAALQAALGALRTPDQAGPMLQPAIAKLGENLVLRRFERFERREPGQLSFYIHPSGRKQGALIELGTANEAAASSPETAALAKELLLQVVAMNAKWIRAEDVPADVAAKEREIYSAQLKNEGKPDAAIPKIVEGKVQKLFFQAFCLLSQLSMRDNKTPIASLVKEAGQKAGGEIIVRRFLRYQLGE